MSLGSMPNNNDATMAYQDDQCSMDYVGIDGEKHKKQCKLTQKL